jgi:hypothetical protein
MGSVLRRRRVTAAATLDDVVEYLRGIATILMTIDANLQRIAGNGDDDDGETRP